MGFQGRSSNFSLSKIAPALKYFRCFAVAPLGLSGALTLCFLSAPTLASLPYPPTLDRDEFLQVYRGLESGPTAQKLRGILSYTVKHAFLSQRKPQAAANSSSIGKQLSISAFNLEQGRKLDQILHLIQKASHFSALGKKAPHHSSLLFDSDVLLLNEADWGTCRAGFRNVAEELGHALGYELVFGTEFIEVQPERVGLVPGKRTKDCPQPRFQPRAPQITGNAILSRYPIRRVERVTLPQCHDWFLNQRDGLVQLEERQTRRGGRMALIATLDLPGTSRSEDVTVVVAHLENKSWPGCRQHQLQHLLQKLEAYSGPVMIGGDLNTWAGPYEGGLFQSASRLGYSWAANDRKATFTLAGLPVRLDYLLFREGQGIGVKQALTLDQLTAPVISDHAPVFSRFWLNF